MDTLRQTECLHVRLRETAYDTTGHRGQERARRRTARVVLRFGAGGSPDGSSGIRHNARGILRYVSASAGRISMGGTRTAWDALFDGKGRWRRALRISSESEDHGLSVTR